MSKYNGWKNRETWVAALHLYDSSAAEGFRQTVLNVIASDEEWTTRKMHELARGIEEFFYEAINYDEMPLLQRDFCSLSEVAWYDLAIAVVDDANDYLEEYLSTKE